MKNQLLIALMALASLLFIVSGASAGYRFPGQAGITGLEGAQLNSDQVAKGHERFICGFGFSVCEGTLESEMAPATAREQQSIEEFVPAGSSSHREDMKPGWVPHDEASGQSQPY
jgi:hypothetical protein